MHAAVRRMNEGETSCERIHIHDYSHMAYPRRNARAAEKHEVALVQQLIICHFIVFTE